MKTSPHDVAMLSVTEYMALNIAWSKNKDWFDEHDIHLAIDRLADIENKTGIKMSQDETSDAPCSPTK